MGNKCFVPLEGGESIPVPLADTAPGATWLFTVPLAPVPYEYELRTLHFKCNTDLNVANRTAILLINDTLGNVHWSLYFTQVLINGQTGNFDIFVGCSRANWSALLTANYYNYNDSLPAIRLLPGWTLGAYFDLLQAGDTFTEIRILAHRWRT